MSIHVQRITPCLWFDHQAEEAAGFYTEIFEGGRIGRISRYGKDGREFSGLPEGSVMTIEFEIAGQAFLALNGGPTFKPNEAVSLMVMCDTQEEIDHYWDRLTEGGDPAAQICGWLKDRYGFSWQVTPRLIGEWISGDPAGVQRVMRDIHHMKKLDMEALRRAYEGR